MSALGQERIREYPEAGPPELIRGKEELHTLAPFRRSEAQAIETTEVNCLAPSLTMHAVGTPYEAIAPSTFPKAPVAAWDVWERQPNPPTWVLFWTWHERKEKVESGSLGGRISDIPERIELAAEKYARSVGLYGSLVLAKQIIREQLASCLSGISVDLREDPDDVDYATVCFVLQIRESAERMLELDQALQETMIEKIPARDLVHISILYRFE